MFKRLSVLSLLWMLSAPAFAFGPRVIYGADDRVDYFEVQDTNVRRNADATVALMRASSLEDQGSFTNIKTTSYGAAMGLCANEPFYEQETAAFCSGFLVTPELVVTAGHCIRSQSACENTRFVFGFRLEHAGVFPHSVPSENVFTCKELIHSVAEADGEDFAVVRLDRPVTHVRPLAYRTSGKINIGDGLTVIGYPAGLPLKVAGGAQVRDVKAQHLVANLDTYGGNSGSSVFNSVSGEVEGILVRGEMDYRYENNCRVSNRCDSNACRGEDVTLFERVLPFLN